ncbi:MAG: hypothetical protein KJZ78_28770, partial [Bryobacteraceae bacterium]|nr:hypothetical protein [Bryobacteraceae bacterium]
MAEQLLPTRFLFRFAAPCLRWEGTWSAKVVLLPDSHRLPSLGQMEGQREFADFRAGWNDAGLYFSVTVENKKHALWCRENKLEDSDGVQLWIDTRDTHNIHRASRFCHRFVFLAAGGGRQLSEPVADQLLVDRARENAQPVRPGWLKTASKVSKTGYQMSMHIPAAALTGFNPVDHPKLG